MTTPLRLSGPPLTRRRALAALGAGAGLGCPAASVLAAPRRVALLSSNDEAGYAGTLNLIHQSFAELGLQQGRDFVLDVRYANMRPERLVPLAAELMAAGPALILAPGRAAAAAFTVESDVPLLVMGDPVLAGQAQQPRALGGRVTGVNILFQPLNVKRLEFLAELCESGSTVLIIATPEAQVHSLPSLQAKAQQLGLRLHAAYARNATELDEALALAAKLKPAGINQLNSPILWSLRQRTFKAAAALRIPAIYQWAEAAGEGGLMAYGPRNSLMWRQYLSIAKRVLEGEAPGSIPIQEPTHIQLALNQGAARALGLRFPPTLLARADEVLE